MVCRPLITIGLPAYNAEKTISATISSIISQTYDNWELILIDDGSSDSTITIASKFEDARIVIVSDGENRGISSRLNQAISMANGQYFCRMDADDLAFPNRLEKQVVFLEKNTQIDVVATSILIFRDNGSLDGIVEVQERHELICKHAWRGFYFPHPTWMGKTQWFKLHPYSSEADGAEDQLLLYSSFRSSCFAGIQDVLLAYREDSRVFEKMLKRRKMFWNSISKNAIVNGHLMDFSILLLIQPLKILADLINIKFGVKFAKNRIIKPSLFLENSWHKLWVDSSKIIQKKE